MRARASTAAGAAAALASICCAAAAATPTTAAGYCAAGRALVRVDPAAAKAALVQAALLDPNARCIGKVQAKLAAPPPQTWDETVESAIARWTAFAGALAGAVLAAIFVVAVAFGLATHSQRVRRVLRGIPLVRRLMQPRISL